MLVLYVSISCFRHWIIIGDDGKKLNMRNHPTLSCVTSSADGDVITLRAPGMPDLKMPLLPDVRSTQMLTQSQVAGEPRVRLVSYVR